MLSTSWIWSPKSCPATKMQSAGLCQPHTILRRQRHGLQHSFWCCTRCASQCRCSSSQWSHRRATKQPSVDCCSRIGRAVKHEKAGLPRMAITWAGTIHNVSNWSLRQVDGLLPDHLSDQLGSQQDWNTKVWPVWVFAGFCTMLGGPALLCHQPKNLTVWGDPTMLVMKTAMLRQTFLLELHHWAASKCCNWVFLINFSLVCHLYGCILGELLGVQPIFMGASTMNQLERITEIMSTLTRADLDATHFSFHFLFCLFAP